MTVGPGEEARNCGLLASAGGRRQVGMPRTEVTQRSSIQLLQATLMECDQLTQIPGVPSDRVVGPIDVGEIGQKLVDEGL